MPAAVAAAAAATTRPLAADAILKNVEPVVAENGVEELAVAENGAKEEHVGVENFLVFGNGLKRKQDIRRVKRRSERKREERKRPSGHLRDLRVMPITAALLIIAKTI